MRGNNMTAKACSRGTRKIGNRCISEKQKKLHFTGRRYIYARSGEGIKTKGLLLTDSEFKKAHERWRKSQ